MWFMRLIQENMGFLNKIMHSKLKKHITLTQCCYNAESASKTAGLHK